MNASKLNSDLEKKTHLLSKNFNCTICMDFFQTPVITNCQHVFCKKCIEAYIGEKRFKNCPLCKNQINTRSLKEFDALNSLVSKAKDLSDALNTDKSNLISKGILKENITVNNKNAVTMLKRKRSICNDDEDSYKRSRTSDARLSINNKNNSETDSTTTKVEKWLNTIEPTTIEQNKENMTELDGNNNKACSKITITRLNKTKDLNNNNNDKEEEEKTLNINNNDVTTMIDDTQQNTIDLNNKKAQLEEYYNISNIDNPIRFREEQESTHNVTSKSKPTNNNVTTNDTKDSTTNLNDFIQNFDDRPNPVLVISKTNSNRTKLVKFFYKGSLKYKHQHQQQQQQKKSDDQTNEINNKTITKVNNSTNTETQTDTHFSEYTLIESILINEVYNNLKEEVLNEFLNSLKTITNNKVDDQQNKLNNTIILPENDQSIQLSTSKKTLSSTSELSKSKKKPLFRKSSSRFQTLDFESLNETDKKTINETVIEPSPTSVTNKITSNNLIVEDTPTKNDESNEKLNEINRTLSKSANRMELVDSRIYLKNLTFETTTLLSEDQDDDDDNDDVDNEEEDNNYLKKQEETNLEKTIILEDKEEPTVKKSNEKLPNYSHVMNSMNLNDTTYINMTNINNTTTTNNNSKELLKYPPPANDILGASYVRDSMSLMITEEKPSTNKLTNSLEDKENKIESTSTTNITNSLKDKETQLLTESQLNLIDNISKQNNSFFEKKIQNESFTVQKNKKVEAQKIEFVCSLLKPDMKELLKNFSKHINAKIENDVTDTTTHLVVDSDENLICGVTSKYLKAISRKIWIVSILWIKACIKNKQLIDPAKFEIQGDSIFGVHSGPRNSRLSASKLFDSHQFLFLGKFETEKIPIDEIIHLAELNGARVIKRAKDFTSTGVRIVIFDQSKTVDSEVTNKMKREASLCSLNMSWLLDSLACYKLFEFDAYALYDT